MTPPVGQRELSLAVPLALPGVPVGMTRAITVTGVPRAAGFGVVARTVAVLSLAAGLRVGVGFGFGVGFGGGVSVYHPVPVNVKEKVTFLQASWLTSGRSMRVIGFGAGTVRVLPAGTTTAPLKVGSPRSRFAMGHATGASTWSMPREVTVIGALSGLLTEYQR